MPRSGTPGPDGFVSLPLATPETPVWMVGLFAASFDAGAWVTTMSWMHGWGRKGRGPGPGTVVFMIGLGALLTGVFIARLLGKGSKVGRVQVDAANLHPGDRFRIRWTPLPREGEEARLLLRCVERRRVKSGSRTSVRSRTISELLLTSISRDPNRVDCDAMIPNDAMPSARQGGHELAWVLVDQRITMIPIPQETEFFLRVVRPDA